MSRFDFSRAVVVNWNWTGEKVFLRSRLTKIKRKEEKTELHGLKVANLFIWDS